MRASCTAVASSPIANWTPNGFQGRAAALGASLATRAPSAPSPYAWGEDGVVERLLGPHVSSLELRRRTLVNDRFATAAEWLANAERFAPPMVAVRSAVSTDAYAGLRTALLALAREFGDECGGRFALPMEYLRVVAIV